MKKITVGAVFSVFLAVSAFSQQTQPGLTPATVLRVIDGDTIELAGGEVVRLIGVDTPEPGEPGAGEATRFVRERTEGLTVWLEADGRDRDAHGRLRRYVWLRQPTDTRDANQIRRYQLNALLLSGGHARVMIVGSVRNEALFRQLAYTYTAVAVQSRFVGNRNSRIFHTLACNSLPGPQNRIYFYTREDAIRAGHRACQRCGP